jgi:hypothetical protein
MRGIRIMIIAGNLFREKMPYMASRGEQELSIDGLIDESSTFSNWSDEEMGVVHWIPF